MNEEERLVKVDQITNVKQATFKEIYNMGYLPAKASDKEEYKMTVCNLAVSHDILNEYSKDKYWHIAQVFDKVGEERGYPQFAFFNNWLSTGQVPEIVDRYQQILVAKQRMLDYEIFKLTQDDSNDYFRDKNGEILFDESGKPVENKPAIARLKMQISHLNAINMQINPDYGKSVREKEEAEQQIATVDVMAQAFVQAARIQAGTNAEQEVNQDFIDHEKDS